MVDRKSANRAIAIALDREIKSQGDSPHVTFDFTLVPHGYQLDLKINGKVEMVECRDFGGSPNLGAVAADLIRRVFGTIDKWRENH